MVVLKKAAKWTDPGTIDGTDMLHGDRNCIDARGFLAPLIMDDRVGGSVRPAGR